MKSEGVSELIIPYQKAQWRAVHGSNENSDTPLVRSLLFNPIIISRILFVFSGICSSRCINPEWIRLRGRALSRNSHKLAFNKHGVEVHTGCSPLRNPPLGISKTVMGAVS